MGKMKEIWASSVTDEMTDEAGLDSKDTERLIEELDDAVMRVCQDFGIS
jgi:hypothetical protein